MRAQIINVDVLLFFLASFFLKGHSKSRVAAFGVTRQVRKGISFFFLRFLTWHKNSIRYHHVTDPLKVILCRI